MDKFTEFWAGIWESEEKTTLQPWMEKVEKKIRAKVTNVKEFIVAESDIAIIIKQRKNWTAPGIDGIENFWWKIFKSCWRPLSRIMNCWVKEKESIPKWVTLGKTALLPKSDDLSCETDYRPITCPNTSYKIFTSVLGNYMKEHAMANERWNQNQIDTV